jgi:hypothetical protein
MKSTIAVGLLAGLASAAYHQPRHFGSHQEFAKRNGTEASTTLTVDVTSVYTVTSCAATVTNCPARNNTSAFATLPSSALTTAVVTEVVDITTTICPVTAAEAASSSLARAYTSGLITGSTRTLTSASVSSNVAAVSVTPSLATTSFVATYTVGPSTARSVIVTTIQSTYTVNATVVCRA